MSSQSDTHAERRPTPVEGSLGGNTSEGPTSHGAANRSSFQSIESALSIEATGLANALSTLRDEVSKQFGSLN